MAGCSGQPGDAGACGEEVRGCVGLLSRAREVGKDRRTQREWLQASARGAEGDGFYPEVSFRFCGSPGSLGAGTCEGQKTEVWGAGGQAAGLGGRGRGDLQVPEGVYECVREGPESSALHRLASEGLVGTPGWDQV